MTREALESCRELSLGLWRLKLSVNRCKQHRFGVMAWKFLAAHAPSACQTFMTPASRPRLGRSKLGDQHPETLRFMIKSALLLRDEGYLQESEPLFREALESSRGPQRCPVALPLCL